MRIILVDNNSSDNTLNTLYQWKATVEAPDFEVRIANESYPTASAARRKGSEIVDTDYVMFFDSDDMMAPDHVERVMAAFRANPAVDMVGWDFDIATPDGKHIKRCRFWVHNLMWHNLLNGSLSTQRYAMKKSLLTASGNWNPRLKGWDDLELGVRLALQNPKVIRLDGDSRVTVIRHADSITGSNFSHSPAKWEDALTAIDNNLLSRRHRRIAMLKRATLAGEYAKEGATEAYKRQMSILRKRERCPFYRMLYHAAACWVKAGIPGVSYLFRPFF